MSYDERRWKKMNVLLLTVLASPADCKQRWKWWRWRQCWQQTIMPQSHITGRGRSVFLMRPSLIYSAASTHSKRSLKGGMMGHEIRNTHSSCWSCWPCPSVCSVGPLPLMRWASSWAGTQLLQPTAQTRFFFCRKGLEDEVWFWLTPLCTLTFPACLTRCMRLQANK